MNLLGRCRQNVAIWLLLLFAGQQTSNLAFLHVHRLANGTIIVHAHYYSNFCANNPIQPNNHTLRELVWLAALTITPFTQPLFAVFLWSLLLSVISNTGFRLQTLHPQIALVRAAGRGPPYRVIS